MDSGFLKLGDQVRVKATQRHAVEVPNDSTGIVKGLRQKGAVVVVEFDTGYTNSFGADWSNPSNYLEKILLSDCPLCESRPINKPDYLCEKCRFGA